MADNGRKNGRLAQMIQAARAKGETYRSISARANDGGHVLSHGQVRDYEQGLVTKAPDVAQIAALGEGLRISSSEVKRAVFIDWYNIDPLEGIGYTIAVEAELSDDRKRELELFVDSWLIAQGLK